jgi:hypothetical protein
MSILFRKLNSEASDPEGNPEAKIMAMFLVAGCAAGILGLAVSGLTKLFNTENEDTSPSEAQEISTPQEQDGDPHITLSEEQMLKLHPPG